MKVKVDGYNQVTLSYSFSSQAPSVTSAGPGDSHCSALYLCSCSSCTEEVTTTTSSTNSRTGPGVTWQGKLGLILQTPSVHCHCTVHRHLKSALSNLSLFTATATEILIESFFPKNVQGWTSTKVRTGNMWGETETSLWSSYSRLFIREEYKFS